MTRHVGAFIQNTIKPCIESLDELLGKCKHLKLKHEQIMELAKLTLQLELQKTFMNVIGSIVMTLSFLFTVYLILH